MRDAFDFVCFSFPIPRFLFLIHSDCVQWYSMSNTWLLLFCRRLENKMFRAILFCFAQTHTHTISETYALGTLWIIVRTHTNICSCFNTTLQNSLRNARPYWRMVTFMFDSSLLSMRQIHKQKCHLRRHFQTTEAVRVIREYSSIVLNH